MSVVNRVITLAIHKGRKTTHWFNQNLKQIHAADTRGGKTCASKPRLVLVLLLIGGESDASFLKANH